LCLCALVPRLQTRTRVVLVLHQLELRKPTNTGQLAARCLDNSATVIRGDREEREDLTVAPSPALLAELAPPATALFLFPHRDAQPLERWRDHGGPLTLVVPDGTWRQAARVRRRVAGLGELACARLPPAAPTAYRLRQDRHRDRLSTIEAVARALGTLESPAVEESLLHIFRVMVERTLWSKGRLAAERVTGGVPGVNA
jgi:DTW domain-containing protein YfiP